MNPQPEGLEKPPVPSEADRRSQSDRRKKPTDVRAALPPAGRRMANRRADEHRRPYFVDRFSSALFLFVLMLVVASLVDAVLTLELLGAGAKEINPLMGRLIEHGILYFLIGKYVLTVAGLPLLLIFKNYYVFGSRIRVGHLIPAAVVLYGVLISYQLVLMHRYMGS